MYGPEEYGNLQGHFLVERVCLLEVVPAAFICLKAGCGQLRIPEFIQYTS